MQKFPIILRNLEKCPECLQRFHVPFIVFSSLSIYLAFQNWRTPNSERGRGGSSGARKYLEKKIVLPEEESTVTKYYSSYVAVSFLRIIIHNNHFRFFTPK
jgi:hypothetical protein